MLNSVTTRTSADLQPLGHAAASGPRTGAVDDRPTVFVIDDEPGIQTAITLTLQRAGYRVQGFSSVSGVSAVLAEVKPFLVILDVALENSDAVEALQILSDCRFEGAVQLLSGTSRNLLHDIRLIGERRKLRMLPVLVKPCSMQAVRGIADGAAALLRDGPADADPASSNAPLINGASARSRVSLDKALERERVEVWYQPKFELPSGTMIGAECLARVRQPSGEIVPPGLFLPGATLGTLSRLTEFVLRQALADWHHFRMSGNPLRLSVNVPSQLITSFPLAALLRERVPVSADWPGLILEITEEDALRDVERAHEAATQLKIYGVELSIDDFGLGYSSLARLREIPFTEIKLDRSLVHGCAADPTRAALCKAVVELAHTLGSAVVAEGLETEDDLACLRAIGCDIVQGYLFGRPMPKPDLIDRIVAGAMKARPVASLAAESRPGPIAPPRHAVQHAAG